VNQWIKLYYVLKFKCVGPGSSLRSELFWAAPLAGGIEGREERGKDVWILLFRRFVRRAPRGGGEAVGLGEGEAHGDDGMLVRAGLSCPLAHAMKCSRDGELVAMSRKANTSRQRAGCTDGLGGRRESHGWMGMLVSHYFE
jgi:hypothetical protein